MSDAKRTRISVEDFVTAYLQASVDGLTRDELATELGLGSLSVYQRANKLRNDGLDLPVLEGESGRVPVLERAKAALEAFKKAS